MWNVPDLQRNSIDESRASVEPEDLLNDDNNSILGVSRLEIKLKE